MLQNPPSGATITWSLTTTGVFNLTPSGSSATLTKISDGSDTLRAMVGSCIIASKDVTTITIPEIHNTQYGTCSGTWQEWYLQASSNNGGSNWQWYPGTLPPGVQVNIYNPNSSSTYASVSGGAAAVLLNFVDNCGNPVNAGTTIYSPCPSLTLFQAIFLPERKSIKVELTQLEGNEKIDPQKFLLGKNIEKLTVFAPNEESATLEKAFATGSYEAERRIRSKGRQIFGGN